MLPEGCKDLLDVIQLEQRIKEESFNLAKGQVKLGFGKALFLSGSKTKVKAVKLGEFAGVPPPITGELLVSEPTTVGKLAELLSQKPASIIADLMQLGVFASVNQAVSFAVISKVARKYGYAAKRQS